MAGQEAVASVNGPMAKTLDDITLFAKTIVDSQPWLLDPKCIPIPWRQVESNKKLKIAVLWNDGVVNPTPPVTRALKETVEKLQKTGHEIVEWDPALHSKAIELLVSFSTSIFGMPVLISKGRMFVADGGKSVEALLAPTNEPIRPEMQAYKDAEELGVHAMWQLHLERSELQKKMLDLWMSYEGLDAILCKASF